MDVAGFEDYAFVMPTKPNYASHDTTYRQLKEDGFSGWGGETFEARMQSWDATIQQMLQFSKFPSAPAKLLELGSGAGDVALKFAKLGYQISGIEISKTGVQWSREKAANENLESHFVQGSVCDLGAFQNGSFDAVIDGNCLHCIIGEDRRKCLAEVHRVLVPRGLFYVSTMVGDLKQEKAHFKFDPITRCQIQNNIPYRYMGYPEDIFKELQEAGFEILKHQISSHPWWDHLSCYAQKASLRR